MSGTVEFECVSKQYTLGLSRVSLPSMISAWARRAAGGARDAADRSFWALRDVTFTLEHGDSLALVGANGAGKTTILKLLARITAPTSGRIGAHGKLSALIELGAGFHPDLTGRENVFLNGAILGLSRRDVLARFDEIVGFAELSQFIDTPVKRYSSGMVVRLGFAVASCIEPEILLVDEVLAVGDSAFQQKCLKRIRTLLERGTTIVFVSHNFYLIQAVCNCALYLKKGQMVHLGPTKDVIDLYEADLHQERARRFIASHLEPTGADDDIEITRVDVDAADGIDGDVLVSTQAVRIRIHYTAFKPLGRVHVSMFVMRSDGLTCCMMRTKLDGVDLTVDRGEGIVAVEMRPLQLVSGTYYVEASFLNSTDSMVITSAAGRSDWFTVKGTALSYEESSGIFEPRAVWEHSRVEPGRRGSELSLTGRRE